MASQLKKTRRRPRPIQLTHPLQLVSRAADKACENIACIAFVMSVLVFAVKKKPGEAQPFKTPEIEGIIALTLSSSSLEKLGLGF